ncbi:MAG: serine/threonine-protein kinase [Thermoguttaceae bacterium]
MTAADDQFRDLLDRWEELREQGQEPSVEELCREAPHLAERLREWTRVLKTSDWMCRTAAEAADETLGEAGGILPEERDQQRTLGEYDLLEELGGGGMGRVFKAIHRKMNRTVAVKLLPESLVQSPESVQRFQREVQALARLSHPNVVAVHDAGEADGTHFYVMDLVDGDDLARLVREHGPLPMGEALDCVLQAARGLEYAHARGVVHRDVKPSNLILDRDGTLKILDLGIARFRSLPEQAGDDLTRTGCVLGTVDYMAPEQAMNTRRADHRADVYSLGCTLYFLLSGQPLFDGDTVMERLVAHRERPVPSLRKACPAAPEWLDRVFRKMVAKKPEDRYQSVTALVADLAQRSAPRNRRWLVLAVTAVLLAVGTWGAWLATRPRGEPSSRRREQGTPVGLPATPSGTLPEQQRQEKPLDLPVKPTWRTTGEYPLIAGVWSIVEDKGTLVTIVQHAGDFVATTTYKSGEETVSWRAEGKISKSGHVTMSLVHTQPHPPDKWLPETRTAVLGLHGKSLEGYAAFAGGGEKFTWKLVEPREAEGKELPR